MAFDPNQQAPLQPAPNPQSLTEEQIRAMRGDLSAGPAPTPAAPAAATPGVAPMTPKPAAAEPALNIPARPAFDADEPAFSPNTTTQMATPVDDLVAAHGSKKKMLWIIISIAVVIGLGLVGYFVVYPMFAGAPEVVAPPVTPPAAVTPAPPAAPAHASVFVNEPAGRANESITAVLSKAAINDVFTKQSPVVNGTTEIVMTTASGMPLAFGEFMPAVAPSFTEAVKTNTLFADDFTAFVFKDTNGVWPGYIGSLKSDFSPETLKTWFTSLEAATLSEFFIVAPGAMQPFKDGMVNNKYPNRYAVGKTAGASFGYLVLPEQKKVLISTSFDGLKDALRLMGL